MRILRKLCKDKKAQAGIGIMIIFIAMVLIAAVVAGVIIRVGYLVQQQAEETGINAIADVSSGLKVVAMLGDRGVLITPATNDTPTFTDEVPTLAAAASGTVAIEIILDNERTVTEQWWINCTVAQVLGVSAGTFSVNGSISGPQGSFQTAVDSAEWSSWYTTPNGKLTVRIRNPTLAGTQYNYSVGDRFEFNTTAAVYELSGSIQILEIKVRLHAGSQPLNMRDIIIQITDGAREVDLKFRDVTTNFALYADSINFTVEAIRDPDNSWAQQRFVAGGTLVKIYINASAICLNLVPQTHVILKLVPRTGIATYEVFTTPAAYGGNRYIELV